MGGTDKFMPLSQFNSLLEGCGYEPVTLENEYLLISAVKGICDIDLSHRNAVCCHCFYLYGTCRFVYENFVCSGG